MPWTFDENMVLLMFTPVNISMDLQNIQLKKSRIAKHTVIEVKDSKKYIYRGQG